MPNFNKSSTWVEKSVIEQVEADIDRWYRSDGPTGDGLVDVLRLLAREIDSLKLKTSGDQTVKGEST